MPFAMCMTECEQQPKRPLGYSESITTRSPAKPLSASQLVWLFWPQPPIRQKFKKLRKVWTGPWKIEEFRSPLVVKIRHVTKRTRQTVHVDRLIPCLTPQALDEPENSLVDLFGDGEHPSNVEPYLQPDAPLEETQDFESQQLDKTQFSQRPTRTRRLPTALEPYIVG